MYQPQITISFDHEKLGHLLERQEFGRFSDLRFKGRGDLNEALQELASPALSYTVKKIQNIEKDTVRIGGGVPFKSPILAKVLAPCEEAVFFVVTIGSAIEEEVARLNDGGRLTDAYILDRLGSLTAEYTVNTFYGHMKRHYGKKGFGLTLRFSPGYCDWPITEQKKLFHLVDTDRIGVTMTASCLMHPRKTVSGIFGLYRRNAEGKPRLYNPCAHCDNRTCNARRHGDA